jgi:tetratricopeptide (TPR) repeat protein
MQAKNAPPPPASTPKPAVNSNADIAKKVNKLLDDARNAEKQGNQQDALSDYAMVLKLQPGNQDAQSNTDRIEQAIRNDPAAARNELKSAIRYFYHSQFDDARRALMNYLESPQTARNPGVADFYLGATLIERSMLQTPRTQWKGPSPDALSAFQQARKANYNPVREYISPALLKIWDSTGQ